MNQIPRPDLFLVGPGTLIISLEDIVGGRIMLSAPKFERSTVVAPSAAMGPKGEDAASMGAAAAAKQSAPEVSPDTGAARKRLHGPGGAVSDDEDRADSEDEGGNEATARRSDAKAMDEPWGVVGSRATSSTTASVGASIVASSNDGDVSVGEQVEVQGRHWPGINKEGGVGTVKAVHDDGTIDVKLVLSGESTIPRHCPNAHPSRAGPIICRRHTCSRYSRLVLHPCLARPLEAPRTSASN